MREPITGKRKHLTLAFATVILLSLGFYTVLPLCGVDVPPLMMGVLIVASMLTGAFLYRFLRRSLRTAAQ